VAGFAAAVFALFPIAWGVVTSLKTRGAIFQSPPQWWPDPATGENYRAVLLGSNMPVYFRNSLIVTISSIVLTLTVASLAAYALARFRLKGKPFLMFVMLATSMIPTIAVVVPLYSIASQTGLLDTLTALVLAFTAWQVPMSVWLLRGFFQGIPQSLDESALIDGCSRFQAFRKIILPLSRPGLAAAAVLVWIYTWNDFIIPITLTASDAHRVVSIGLYYYITVFGIEWGHLMAAVVLVLAPAILAFAFLQRSFVSGLTAGATKE